MSEAAERNQSGSAGAAWVRNALEQTGQSVDVLQLDTNRYGYDVELISVHHERDYERLVTMPKRGHIRIIGGHVTYTNPRPMIPLSDVICVGDGESWIVEAAKRLNDGGGIDSLRTLQGTIISDSWVIGDCKPPVNQEKPIPDNPPFLSKEGQYWQWNIEIARGCPYRCSYCEIGHTVKYRYKPIEQIKHALELVDASQSNWIRLIAPEEGSHPHYEEILEAIKEHGYIMKSGGYRVEQILRRHKKGQILPVSNNQSVRVGLDGLTEETRRKVAKPIADDQLLEFFKLMLDQGHVKFKLYQIIGYSWDTLDDVKQWEALMDKIFALPKQKSCTLDITWTPLVPQSGTPLENEPATYNAKLAKTDKAVIDSVASPIE